MSNQAKAVGVDIGGSKTLVAAIDGTGQIRARAGFETASRRGFAVFLATVVESISRLLRQAGWEREELAGIGIGCAGPVNPERGTIHNPYTLPGWEEAAIVPALREACGVPVRLENDADAAALGEFQFGAGRGASSLVMVTLGTGVGGAAILGGAIHRGVAGEHPEFGHLAVSSDGPDCYCGIRGCWESLASGTALAHAGQPLGFSDSRAIFAAAPEDARARSLVERAVEATARATWTLLHTFLPERILLGGGIGAAHFELFAAAIGSHLRAATQFSRERVQVVRAQLGPEAGVIGAAGLVLSNPSS